jgi:hypothetical protein
MKLAQVLMEKRALEAKAASVEDLPARKWKSPLQLSVQILKCHRDLMFVENDAAKPISVILTTLAAEAYQGEQNISDALDGILRRMGGLVRAARPRVPNPVNPVEDFADKWYDPAYKHLNLEKNFNDWLKQAQIDFDILGKSRDPEFIAEQAITKFGAALDIKSLRSKFAIGAPAVLTQPKTHTIIDTPAKPWVRR